MAKTIYIRDEDIPTWDRAKELAGDKLAPTIVEGLKRFVAEKEAAAKGFERIEVRYEDTTDNRLQKVKAFFGRWIISPDEPLQDRDYDEEGRIETQTAVAESSKGNWVFLRTESGEAQFGPWTATTFDVRASLSEAAKEPKFRQAAQEALVRRGVEIEELDI